VLSTALALLLLPMFTAQRELRTCGEGQAGNWIYTGAAH
jgi:hypothetical protein